MHPLPLPNMVRVAGNGSLSQTCACCFLNTEGQVSLNSGTFFSSTEQILVVASDVQKLVELFFSFCLSRLLLPSEDKASFVL